MREGQDVGGRGSSIVGVGVEGREGREGDLAVVDVAMWLLVNLALLRLSLSL